MGRMAEARKRARKKAAEPEAAGLPPEPPGDTSEGGDAGRAEDGAGLSDISGEISEVGETVAEAEAPAPEATGGEMVFPADPAPGAKIQLPASGTAEEILARAEAQALEPDMAAAAVASAVALSEPQLAASISFFSAPAREERAAVEAAEHLATFFLDREEYGVDVRLVEGFRRVTQITPVPRAPAFIRGVINLRGRIIPVVDLKRKLGLGEVKDSRAARIAVVKIQDRLIGMLVDGASQVLKVPVSSIEPAPDEVVEKGGDYIRGVAKLEKRLIILVDLHRILILDGRAAPAGGA
jgi:purine-binding chemotaxis protein CheW